MAMKSSALVVGRNIGEKMSRFKGKFFKCFHGLEMHLFFKAANGTNVFI
jgi:hypothetical protein